jgi:predicted dehydrogenase
MIYLEERDCGVINVTYNDGKHEAIPYQPQAGYYNELLNFHKALMGEEPISVTPELEFGDLHLIDDILSSIKESRVMNINEPLTYQPVYNWRETEVQQYRRM